MEKIKRSFHCFLYYGFARHLPISYLPGGKIAKAIRAFICRRLFKKCGKDVNVEAKAFFNTGREIELGDHSDIGVNAKVFGPVVIGKDVMMGPDVVFVGGAHEFGRIDIPMRKQGFKTPMPTIVSDDVWIGTRALILAGVKIGRGAIIGAGAVVTKDIPDWAVVVGNPAQVIRLRK